MAKVRVEYYERRYVTREGDYDDKWDRDSTDAEITVEGISVVEDWGHLSTNFEVERNKPYYLLYAVYGTGDSFGSDGGQTEWIALYEDADLAYEQKRELENGSTKLVLDGDGTSCRFAAPWNGYFEWLEYISVATVFRQR